MKFRDKMKDVELSPYMLAIYRDNEHHHLLKHALECWEHRTRNPQPTNPAWVNNRPVSPPTHLVTNPIHFCSYPPLELIKQYDISPHTVLSSKLIKCPKVAKWAFDQHLDNWVDNPEMIVMSLTLQFSENFRRIVSIIEYDDELIYKLIMMGVATYMPPEFQEKLNEEQRNAAIICAIST